MESIRAVFMADSLEPSRSVVAVREFKMMRIVDMITDKPDWHKKI